VSGAGDCFGPLPFEQEFAALCAANPTDDDSQACADAGRFLRNWGEPALRLGWSGKELFGLHPVAPLARCDAMGLVWLLCGRRLTAITATEAVLANRTRVRRSIKAAPTVSNI